MKTPCRNILCLAALLLAAGRALPAAPAGANAVPPLVMLITNLLGSHTAFAARATVENLPLGVPSALQVGVCRLGDRLRLNFDLRQMPRLGDTPIPTTLLANIGLDQANAYGRMGRSSTWQIVFPNAQVYYEESAELDDPLLQMLARGGRIERTVAGRETIAGHPCVKNDLTVVAGKDRRSCGAVWLATDLQNFPLRADVLLQGRTTTIRFTEVRLGRAEPAYFDVPAGCQRCADVQEIVGRALRGSLSSPKPRAK